MSGVQVPPPLPTCKSIRKTLWNLLKVLKSDCCSMKWIIIFYQVLVSNPEGEIYFSGLTTAQKMTKEIETQPAFYRTKFECEKTLKRLKGNKSLKMIDSFNGEKSFIITNRKPLANKKRIVVNAFQCLEIDY